MKPNPHIALIYHYDLARALAGEVVDWQAIPVNVDAGREGGDLCRAAADFAKRRDLFAMPAPTIGEPCNVSTSSTTTSPPTTTTTTSPSSSSTTPAPTTPAPANTSGCSTTPNGQWPENQSTPTPSGDDADPSAVPVGPNPAVEQQAADPEPSTASTTVPGSAVNVDRWASLADRDRLRARIKGLVDQGHEPLIRRHWPEGVPTLKHDGHTYEDLGYILDAVRRVEAEVGAGWHPDDGPRRSKPETEVEDNTIQAASYTPPDEGGMVSDLVLAIVSDAYTALDGEQRLFVAAITGEANAAGRSISVSQNPTVRRWSIARAVIAWAASGRTLDELWLAVSTLATFEQCRDPSATLGGLVSQFTIEQADRLYDAAHAAT